MSQIASHHQIEVQGINTHFLRVGEGKKPVVFLHGWGGSTQSFFALAHQVIAARPDLSLFLVDLPGFGLTDFPIDQAWDTYRYAEWVYDLMTTLNIPRSSFYVHSFGGRVVVRLHEKHPQVIQKIVFTGSAGIKWPPTWRQKIAQLLRPLKPLLPQTLRRLVLSKILGARDWESVDPKLKATLQNVLEEADLREQLTTIENETLLLWGAKDKITPLISGQIYHQKLPNTQLKVIPKGKHGIHHTHTSEVSAAVSDFL